LSKFSGSFVPYPLRSFCLSSLGARAGSTRFNPYTDAAAWAAKNSIASGIGGKYHLDAPITRQDLAAILCSYAEYMGFKLPVTRDYSGLKDNVIRAWSCQTLLCSKYRKRQTEWDICHEKKQTRAPTMGK
jgi:hypothetical protein